MPIVEFSYTMAMICAVSLNKAHLREGYDAFKQYGLPYTQTFGYTTFKTVFGRMTDWPEPATNDQREAGQCMPILIRCRCNLPREQLWSWPKRVKFGNNNNVPVDTLDCDKQNVFVYIRNELAPFIQNPQGPFKANMPDDLFIFNQERYGNLDRAQYEWIIDEWICHDQPIPYDELDRRGDWPAQRNLVHDSCMFDSRTYVFDEETEPLCKRQRREKRSNIVQCCDISNNNCESSLERLTQKVENLQHNATELKNSLRLPPEWQNHLILLKTKKLWSYGTNSYFTQRTYSLKYNGEDVVTLIGNYKTLLELVKHI